MKNNILFIFIITGVILAGGRKITPEDIVNLKYATSPVMDVSGKNIVYTLSVPRTAEDEPGRSYSEIWVARTDGSDNRRYTAEKVNSWSPQWSVNGPSITFLSKREADEHAQIYVIPLEGGEGQLFIKHESSIASYKWSPDGKWVAFTSSDPKTEEEIKAKKEGRDWVVWDQIHKYTRLWLFNVKTGNIQKLFKGDLHVRSFIWSSDSRSIIFQAAPKTGADRDLMFRQIYRIKVPGGIPRKIITTKGKLGMMSISPDAKNLAFLAAVSENDPLAQSVFIFPFKGENATLLTDGFEESFQYVNWVNNDKLLLKSIRGSKTVLSTLSIIDSSPEGNKEQIDISTGNMIVKSIMYDRNSERLALTGTNNEHPHELFAGSLNISEKKRLTFSNPDLNEVNFAAQEIIAWKAQDGLTIEGILTYPLYYREGKRYPLILMIHGGPEDTSQDGWTTSALYPVQLLAAEGYMVLEPNYRGSGGRGVAFSKGDHDDLGGLEYMDVLAGIDYLAERGMVNKNLVGTGGWSYGGYFSAWGATAHSQRFKASMVGAGLTNWISFAGTTDIPYEMSIVHWNSWWYDEMDLHWERSPLAHINNAQTPTLVIHGQKDDRVHPEQSLELWQALRLKEIPTELVIYPREPHGLLERAHRLDYMNRLVNWYNKYVK